MAGHDRHVRFTLPDPVLSLAERERTAGSWMSHLTARDSVMMQVPHVGAFVRALLPVHLTEAHMVTFGVWLSIDPRELRSVFDVWTELAYQDLILDGLLANAIMPWGMLAAPVTAAVRNFDETPYCDRSSDPKLQSVLTDEWPHDLVLAAVNAGIS